MNWISFATGTVNLTVAGMFLGAWVLTRHRALLSFTACYALFAASFVLFSIINEIEMAAHVGNVLLIAGTLVLAGGLSQRGTWHIPWMILLCIATAGILGIVASFTAGSVDLRHIATYGAVGLITALLATAGHEARPRDTLERVLVFALRASAFMLLTNPRFLTGLAPEIVPRAFADSTFSAYAMLWIILSQLFSGVLIALSMRDVISKARSEARIDSLSGLANRRAFDAAIGRSGRQGDRPALVMLDIDHFKRVNDELGHEEGDRAIALLGRLVASTASNISGGSCVARLGGEEFAVLLTDGGIEAATRVAQAVHTAVRGAKRPLDFTVSIGVAEGPRETLYKRADKALYAAKSEGRNRTCFAPSQAASDQRTEDFTAGLTAAARS